MGDLPGKAHLAEEPLAAVGIVLQPLGQELEGHRLAEREVVGTVDLAHPAAADGTHEAVAAGEERAADEAVLPCPGRSANARIRRRVARAAGCGRGRGGTPWGRPGARRVRLHRSAATRADAARLRDRLGAR